MHFLSSHYLVETVLWVGSVLFLYFMLFVLFIFAYYMIMLLHSPSNFLLSSLQLFVCNYVIISILWVYVFCFVCLPLHTYTHKWHTVVMILTFNQWSEIAINLEYHRIVSRKRRLRMMHMSSAASEAQMSSSDQSPLCESDSVWVRFAWVRGAIRRGITILDHSIQSFLFVLHRLFKLISAKWWCKGHSIFVGVAGLALLRRFWLCLCRLALSRNSFLAFSLVFVHFFPLWGSVLLILPFLPSQPASLLPSWPSRLPSLPSLHSSWPWSLPFRPR